MIFVTVGTQLPFDRLVRVVDEWAARTGRRDVFAQVGRGGARPSHIDWKEHIEPTEFETRSRDATAIIGHAGIGSILAALRYRRPIVIMPRLARHGEHRNDHQLATARHFANRPGILVAMDERELAERLDQLESATPGEPLPEFAQERLLDCVRTFIGVTS